MASPREDEGHLDDGIKSVFSVEQHSVTSRTLDTETLRADTSQYSSLEGAIEGGKKPGSSSSATQACDWLLLAPCLQYPIPTHK
jgi:hypothetical protein